MQPLDLPDELLLSIPQELGSESGETKIRFEQMPMCERDISAFGRTNRCLHIIAEEYLYQHNARWSQSSALLWASVNGVYGRRRRR